MVRLVLILVALLGRLPCAYADDLQRVTGLWATEGDEAVIELYPCESHVCGRFYAMKDEDPRHPSRDDENPDPALRQRPLCGLQFIGGFTPEGEGRLTEGWIYSPRHGSTFNATMTLQDPNTLELHGYVLTPMLGESQIWRRVGKQAGCIPLPLAGEGSSARGARG